MKNKTHQPSCCFSFVVCLGFLMASLSTDLRYCTFSTVLYSQIKLWSRQVYNQVMIHTNKLRWTLSTRPIDLRDSSYVCLDPTHKLIPANCTHVYADPGSFVFKLNTGLWSYSLDKDYNLHFFFVRFQKWSWNSKENA